MRPNQQSMPSLSLLHTSFQHRPEHDHDRDSHHAYNTYPHDYCTSTTSVPTSPLSLSSASTIASTSPTLPSSPTSPSLSPVPFHGKHIRNPHPVSDKLKQDQRHHFSISTPTSAWAGSSPNTLLRLRRRASNIDTALRQERSRANVDAIERQGLELMEPRPVDLDLDLGLVSGGIDGRMQGHSHCTMNERQHLLSLGHGGHTSEPKFVMGGIFEVMEGRG
ncbi:hypothetical protein BDV18DRAFT_132268 [Aspergillus unguis]